MIPEKNEWVFFRDIDFNDPDINQFNIDTRDFHVGYTVESGIEQLNLNKIYKYDHFFHTTEEVLHTLNLLFEGSGGRVTWRSLYLTGDAARFCSGWELKYLRIIRTEKGWVICNNNYRALSKSVLSCPINLEVLHAHNI